MGRRGRPPYPDVLTPREWEVHALLREGLSNEEIAQRLGISLAGAKYHVSEILGKLGVASREEAARWTPERRPWWATPALAPVATLWRRAGSSWVTTGAAAGAFVIVAAGLGLLIWGLLRTSGGDDESTVTCVPRGIVNLLVNVEDVDGTSFTGPAGSTIYTPAGKVTVRVDETTNWVGPVQSIDDVRTDTQLQAVGPLGVDCAIHAVTILGPSSVTPFFTTLGEGLYNGADWSPDGRSVAFALDGVLHRADGPERYAGPLLAEPTDFPVRTPRWSPDGTRIAFIGSHEMEVNGETLDIDTIWLVNADGSGLRDLLPGDKARLSTGIAGKTMQDWVDNDTIAFAQHCGAPCEEPLMLNVEKGEVFNAVTLNAEPTDLQPSDDIFGTRYYYSPDKRWLAADGFMNVSVYDREGQERTDIESQPGTEWLGRVLAWAPDSSAFLYQQPGSAEAPVPDLYRYDVTSGEGSLIASPGSSARYSPDGSLVAYVTEATQERPCGGDARVACIAVMDVSSSEELYRFAGPRGDEVAGFGSPTFVPDGRVLYVTAAGDFAIADGGRTGLLLNAGNVVDVQLSPDASSALVAELGRLTLVPIPPRDSLSLPEPAPLSPPDIGPVVSTPTPEPFVASPIDCPGGFATPEEAIEACYDSGPSDIFVGDCDTPDPSPPAESVFDRPCSIWEDGFTSPRSYVIGNSGVDGFDRVIVERRSDGWVVTARGGCSIQNEYDEDTVLGTQGADLSVLRANDCRLPPSPLPRPQVRVGPYGGAKAENGRTRLSISSGLFYPSRGAKFGISATNISGESLPWTSDVGADIELVAEDGTAHRAAEVGGTLGRSVPEGFPPDKTWSGWLVFRIDTFGRYTLRYPGQQDVELELTPEQYNSSRRDYFERPKE